MRYFVLSLIAFSFLFVLSPAFAACDPEVDSKTCLGEDCATLGATKLDYKKDNIIACLYKDSSQTSKVWKSTSITEESFTCPAGQVLMKVLKGKPVCGVIKTRQAECSGVWTGTYNDMACTATCNNDEMVTGGGYDWDVIFSRSGRDAHIEGNGYRCLINIEDCGPTGLVNCYARCYAICAKIEPVL